ncbi:MAG: TRM11 family methyltransferase [Ilumatobacter sp.]
MTTYRLYLETDLNRVFTQSVGPVAAAELDVVLAHALDAANTEIELVAQGRTSFLRFDHGGEQPALAAAVARLCASAALFVEHSPASLEPVVLDEALLFGTDVVTTQRYKGKTSERLTRLMLNLALSASATKARTEPAVLDPMCGRGTTLNWSLLYGIRSTGMDVDRHALDEYAVFLQQWAQGHRLPHRLQRYKKQDSEHRHFDFAVAGDRKALEAKTVPDIRTFNAPADSTSIAPGRHSMLVSDLPYGVQHRARTGNNEATSVLDLVEQLSAHWPDWLLPGASVVLSWNVRSLAVDDMLTTLRSASFSDVATRGFGHQVDRTITRDVVVARRS